MNIRLYGRLADLLGEEVRLDLSADGCSIAELRAEVARHFPHAEAQIMSPRVRAIVGDAVVNEAKRVGDGDSVEFSPPVSGG